MLIKLRNEFYQVQCDAFGDLATDLLDIRPKFFVLCHLTSKVSKLSYLVLWM